MADSSVPAEVLAAIPPGIETGAVLGGLQTAGEHAFVRPGGRWWRVPVWWVVTDRHTWLLAVHEDLAWATATGEPREVALETRWRGDAIRVGSWRMRLPSGSRKAAAALYATWERGRWGGQTVLPVDPRPAARAPAARAARGLPRWWADEVPADPEARWLVAVETGSTHPLSLPDGTIHEEPLWLGISDRGASLAVQREGAVFATSLATTPTDTGARGEARFDAGERRFAAPRRDAALLDALAIGRADADARWAAAARSALADRAVVAALDLIGEAHERGAAGQVCEPLARVLYAIGSAGLAVGALAEHLRRRPDTDVAHGPGRWAEAARHLRVSAKAERVDEALVKAHAGHLLDAIPAFSPPEGVPWPPADESGVWLAALAVVGRWDDALAVAGPGDAGPRWGLWIGVAGLRAREADPEGVLAARCEAVASDFLRPAALAAALADPGVPPPLAAWWRHLHRLLDATAPDGAPLPPRARLDAADLDGLHPGGAGWLEGARTSLTPPEPPPRGSLVRGLDRVDAGTPAAVSLADVAERLGIPVPPAWLYRGEGAWGAAAWPLDPPVLLLGYDHLADGPRHLDGTGLAFLLAVEVTHLACRHPLLAFDRDLLGTSRSVYAALGRWAGPAETVVDVVGLVPGIDQIAKIQTVARLAKRLLQARGAVDKASGLAAGVASWFKGSADSLPPLAREGLQGAALQFRAQADRAALLLTGDLRAAVDAILRSSSSSLALADRARDEGLAVILAEGALPPDEALRITMLVEFAARQRPDLARGAP